MNSFDEKHRKRACSALLFRPLFSFFTNFKIFLKNGECFLQLDCIMGVATKNKEEEGDYGKAERFGGRML